MYYAEACNELDGAHLCDIAPAGNTAPLEMSQRWRAVGNIISDWPEIWTSDLLLQRRTHYRPTNWLVKKTKLKQKVIHCIEP